MIKFLSGENFICHVKEVSLRRLLELSKEPLSFFFFWVYSLLCLEYKSGGFDKIWMNKKKRKLFTFVTGMEIKVQRRPKVATSSLKRKRESIIGKERVC